MCIVFVWMVWSVLRVDTTCEIINNFWLADNLWLQQFLPYTSNPVELYKKPSNAGEKGDGGATPRRNKTDDIQLFVLSQQSQVPEQQLAHSKSKK